MKIRVLTVMVIMAMLFGPFSIQNAYSQVFLTQEDMERLDRDNPDLPGVPHLAITTDQFEDIENYSPLNGTVLVLGCLGGAYLMSKKRKQSKSKKQ